MTKSKKWLGNLVVLFGALLVCFLLLETIFRLLRLGAMEEEQESAFIKHALYSPFLSFGPNIDRTKAQLHGGPAKWNSQGFRLDQELPLDKGASEYRIFALGGSTTENHANGENLHYAGEAERLLADLPKEVRVINSGRSAFSTAHSLIRFQFDLLPFQPDMVTVMHNINDLAVNFFPSNDERSNYANKYLTEYYANYYDYKDSVLRNSRVLVFTYEKLLSAKSILFDTRVRTDNGEVLSSMRFADGRFELHLTEAFRNNLIAIVKLAEAHNIVPVLMTQPAIFTEDKVALAYGHKPYNSLVLYPPLDQFQQLFEKYNGVIKQVARDQGAYFVDMYNLLGSDEKYYKDMVHLTPLGLRRFAELYAEKVRAIVQKAERRTAGYSESGHFWMFVDHAPEIGARHRPDSRRCRGWRFHRAPETKGLTCLEQKVVATRIGG